mmetsp:Transcript_16177/g.28405  ORF Transcript_16177/g.28405 Transcript_16177/m.28405 type:complete len:204 (+) Transcript_16177:96-707(+)
MGKILVENVVFLSIKGGSIHNQSRTVVASAAAQVRRQHSGVVVAAPALDDGLLADLVLLHRVQEVFNAFGAKHLGRIVKHNVEANEQTKLHAEGRLVRHFGGRSDVVGLLQRLHFVALVVLGVQLAVLVEDDVRVVLVVAVRRTVRIRGGAAIHFVNHVHQNKLLVLLRSARHSLQDGSVREACIIAGRHVVGNIRDHLNVRI